MNKTAIFGAGGHGMTVLDAFVAQNRWLPGFVFLDDYRYENRAGFPIVGGRDMLTNKNFLDEHDIIIAIGDAQARSGLFHSAVAAGARMVSAIHPLSYISQMASVGAGSYVAPFATVGANALVGMGCVINTGAMVGHDSQVHDCASVNDGTVLGGGSEIGEAAYLGTNVSVLPKITVGRHAIVGAGSVVTRDVPAGRVVKGVPAK